MILWQDIDVVLLDMDGTLLDRYFDDYFWEEFVPEQYAQKHSVSLVKAKKKLLSAYKKVERTLQWTDLHYWSDQLGLDIIALKEQIRDQVRVHAGVEVFLQFLRDIKKNVILVTNAHPRSVKIKLEQTLLAPYFETILCSSDIGLPKEEVGFWRDAQKVLTFNKERTLFVDDNENVLLAAHTFGIKHLLHKSNASSRALPKSSGMFPELRDFKDLIPTRT